VRAVLTGQTLKTRSVVVGSPSRPAAWGCGGFGPTGRSGTRAEACGRTGPGTTKPRTRRAPSSPSPAATTRHPPIRAARCGADHPGAVDEAVPVGVGGPVHRPTRPDCRASASAPLPERRGVARMVRWLKPGGWLFVQEPDFYPTWTVEPPSQNKVWEAFILRHSPVTAERKHD
jgi:hypothetical protein